jgi:lathosterol oxidase
VKILLSAYRDGTHIVGVGYAQFIHYAMAAGFAWLFFYVVFRRQLIHRKIIEHFPRSHDIRREIILSMMTSVIYGVVGLLSVYAIGRHWMHLYFKVNQYGTFWFWFSIVLTIFVHDTYFYWTHRLMHHRRLFRYMHKAHHTSVNPTPWAAYAFDPGEAFVQACIFPLILYPIHPLAFLIFMIWQVGFNVMGHAGFEIFPSSFLKSWPGRFLNTPTNHTMHHQYVRGNYGLYFNLWDRWMGNKPCAVRRTIPRGHDAQT